MSLLALVLLPALAASAEPPCDAKPVDLLVLGDSQTGASWASSYHGNFLQRCLADPSHPAGSFAIYGRGGTAPAHWLDGGLDAIPTIQRDNRSHHLNLGAGEQVPRCKTRLRPMLEAHRPRRVLAFFGDNVLGASSAEIARQFDRLTSAIAAAGIKPADCFIMTPTYEMAVQRRRNVAAKDLAATRKVRDAARSAVGTRCRFVDGLALMDASPHLDKAAGTLARAQSAGMSGCLGASGNDNVHVCGEAAKDLAGRVCALLR